MRTVIILLLSIAAAGSAPAQMLPSTATGTSGSASFSLMGIVQRYEAEERDVTQTSWPVSLIIPIRNSFEFQLSTIPATATGSDLETISGFGDVQVASAYTLDIGDGSLVGNVGVNLPSGRQSLSLEEFRTSILISQQAYAFRLPTFGQGFNVAPGLAIAYPVSDGVVLGAAAAYRYRSAFEPVDFHEASYDPGDEVLLTAGLDVSIEPASALSGDVSYTIYADDVFGDETLTSGNKVVVTFRALSNIGFDRVEVTARYRSRDHVDLPLSPALSNADQRTIPTQTELHASYQKRVTTTVSARVFGIARFFGEGITPGRLETGAIRVFDVGIGPGIRLLDELDLVGSFSYRFGDIAGFEAGAGIQVNI